LTQEIQTTVYDPNLVLGIDPGTAIMGYGLVRENTSDELELVEYGVLTTVAGTPMPSRLLSLYGQLQTLLQRYHPAVMVVEELFFNKNTNTALAVGQARGIVLLAGAAAGLQVGEFTPLQVKQALTGYGRATKDQIQQMVRLTLNLDYIPKPDDAADALAIAICHLRSRRLIEALSRE
jgi:crossover junction endodeoxyribonuclease RuvC